MVEKYLERGGNFFDTADVYTGGTSERWLGEFLAQHRSRAVIATKYSGCTEKGNPNAGGNGRANLMRSLDASLKRMGIGWVDVLYVHIWEHRTPVEEVMRALDDAVRSGKVGYLAISDTVAWKIAQANTLAHLRGWSPFIALQTQVRAPSAAPAAGDLGSLTRRTVQPHRADGRAGPRAHGRGARPGSQPKTS